MLVITVASQKGGAGKTTLARSLACAWPGRVAVADLDPQQSLAEWHALRDGEPVLVSGVTHSTVPTAVQRLADQSPSFDLLVIDTPPSAHNWLQDLFSLSDYVLLPVRPSPDDLRAIGSTLAMVEDAGTDFCFVVSQAKPRTRMVPEAIKVLAQHGKVAPSVLHDRTQFQVAALNGSAVTDTKGKAADEVLALVKYLQAQTSKVKR